MTKHSWGFICRIDLGQEPSLQWSSFFFFLLETFMELFHQLDLGPNIPLTCLSCRRWFSGNKIWQAYLIQCYRLWNDQIQPPQKHYLGTDLHVMSLEKPQWCLTGYPNRFSSHPISRSAVPEVTRGQWHHSLGEGSSFFLKLHIQPAVGLADLLNTSI